MGDGLGSCAGGDSEPTSDEEWAALYEDFWVCLVESGRAAVDEANEVAPPSEIVDASNAYLSAFRSLFDALDVETGTLETSEQHEAYLEEFLLGAAPSGQIEQVSSACVALQSAADSAGVALVLGCYEPEEWIEVDVEFDGTWTAAPATVPAGDQVEITITNLSDEPVVPVVVELLEGGDPENLPLVDGLVDLGVSGIIDPASGFTSIWVAYAGSSFERIEGGFLGQPEELAPGASVTTRLFNDAPVVLFDYRRGEFEAGSYVVIERN